MIIRQNCQIIKNSIKTSNMGFAQELINKNGMNVSEVFEQANLVYKEDNQEGNSLNQINQYTTTLYNTLQQFRNTYNQEFNIISNQKNIKNHIFNMLKMELNRFEHAKVHHNDIKDIQKLINNTSINEITKTQIDNCLTRLKQQIKKNKTIN